MNRLWLTGWIISWLVAGLITAFVPALPPAPQMQPDAPRPNILWISCEDMSPRLGCYGDTTVPTPNIDRLAREGIRFSHAFCTAGVCAPSRNAIITGMYQTSTGGHNMRTLTNTYPEKTGLPKEYSVVMPPAVKAFPEYLRMATERGPGYYTANNAKTDYQFEAPPTVWDANGPTAHWRNRARHGDGAGQPFFAVFNSVLTHESQIWLGPTGRKKDSPLRVDPARIKVPPYYPDTKIVRQDMARHYTNIRDMDDWVGDLLHQLEADGLLDKTILFFWSDHGDGLPFIKREVYDRGIRVPLIVRLPGGKFGGTTRSELISMIDLAPTVLQMCGLKPPNSMQGRAFLDANTGRYPSGIKPRQYVFAARDRLDSEYDRVRTVHDGRYQYVRNFFPEKPLYMDLAYRKQQPMMAELLQLRDAHKLNQTQMRWFQPTKPAEELYDIQNDPHELHNLANQLAYALVLKRLRAELNRWLLETNDLGGTPEKELLRQWWHNQSEPPLTEVPQFRQKAGQVRITCATAGASIGYKRIGIDSTWQVYHHPVPLKKGQSLQAVAMRIGYKQSQKVHFKK